MSYFFFFFKQKTAYEMRISDWSSDVCSSSHRTPARKGAGWAAGRSRQTRDIGRAASAGPERREGPAIRGLQPGRAGLKASDAHPAPDLPGQTTPPRRATRFRTPGHITVKKRTKPPPAPVRHIETG